MSSLYHSLSFRKKPRKSTPWDLTFSPRSLRERAKSSKKSSWRPRPLPSSIRPSATSAEKNHGSRAKRGPKVSNNFGPVPTRRNPARGAKIDGGVAEAEAAGGSPRKKPRGPSPRKKVRGEETFLLRLDRAKATAERGRTEPIGLEDPQGDPQGDPDDRTETVGLSKGGRPEKAPPRMTKPPPSPRRTRKRAISTRRRRSSTRTMTTTMDSSVAPSYTSGPTAVAPRKARSTLRATK